MTKVFYIMGSNNGENWVRFEGPFKDYPDMESWTPARLTFQSYKVELVWEFPF